MVLGLILGVLIGGGVATLMTRMKETQASGEDGLGHEHPVIEQLKHQIDEAKQAAHEAQVEKEAEMRRMFDDLVHRRGDTGAE